MGCEIVDEHKDMPHRKAAALLQLPSSRMAKEWLHYLLCPIYFATLSYQVKGLPTPRDFDRDVLRCGRSKHDDDFSCFLSLLRRWWPTKRTPLCTWAQCMADVYRCFKSEYLMHMKKTVLYPKLLMTRKHFSLYEPIFL